MELTFILLTVILSIISLLANLWVTYVYLKNKDLQVHPSTILACISIFEIAMSNHSIAMALETNLSIEGHGPHHLFQLISFFSLSFNDSKAISCAINQMLFVGAITGVLCYNMFLCVDLIITLRNPLISGKQRMIYYHGLAAVLILGEMGYNVYINMNYDECRLEERDYIYEVWNFGMLTVVYAGYIVTAIITVVYSIYKLSTKVEFINSATREYLIRHTKYIIVLSFIWSWAAANFWLDYKFQSDLDFENDKSWVIAISLVLINLSGFIQALLRNWEKSFWVKSKELCKRKRELSKVNSTMSLDMYSSMIFSKDFKETDDMWNMPTSLIMQDSLKTQTTLGILSGIQNTLRKGRENISNLPILPTDIKEVSTHKFSFSDSDYKITINDFYSLSYYIVEEHCPKIFHRLRGYESLSIDEILSSLDPKNNQMTLLSLHQELGGSGSLFIFTQDQQVVLKIITPTERKFLLGKFLYLYFQHLERFPYSLLNRLLGVFTIKIPGLSPLDIVMYPSLVDDSVEKFYDLKGSTRNRLCNKKEDRFFKGPFKDSDFINEKQGFLLHPMIRKRLMKFVKNDAKFLMENGIMDYSLFVSVLKEEGHKTYPNPELKVWYRFGIIDYLGEYSFKRKAEYYAKLIRHGRRIKMCSVMNPRSYYNRFIGFLTESVLVEIY